MLNVKNRLDRLGGALVRAFQLGALFLIGATIVWSAVQEYVHMIGGDQA